MHADEKVDYGVISHGYQIRGVFKPLRPTARDGCKIVKTRTYYIDFYNYESVNYT